MANVSKKPSLIGGLVAIGNLMHERHSDLEELNYQLIKDKSKLSEQGVLDKYTPVYKTACEQYELLDTKLGKAWKTRAKGYGSRSITIGGLFDLIAQKPDISNDTPKKKSDISCNND